MNKISKFLLFLSSIIILILSYLIITEIEFNVKVIELPPESGAKCLDGSNYRFQLMKGSGNGQDKFLLSFDGGGWCGSEAKLTSTTIEACRKRALSFVGKKALPFAFTVSRVQQIFSSKKEYNPEFYNWNKVVIKYCDGFGHQSNNDNYGLHFRGLNNTLGVIDYLKKNLNFKQAESVIVSGFSAGGLASLVWGNYIDAQTDKKDNTYIIPDSGVFYDLTAKDGNHYLNKIMKELIKYSGDNSKLLKTFCKIQNEDELYKCFLPESIFENIKLPILLVQNLYDTAVVGSLYREDCLFHKNFIDNCSKKDMDAIYDIGKTYISKYRQLVKEHKNISAWIPRTLGHTFIVFNQYYDSETSKPKGISLMEMMTQWYRDVHAGKKSKYVNELIMEEDDKHIKEYKDWVYYTLAYNLFTIPGL